MIPIRKILFFIFFIYATVFNLFNDEGRNMLLIVLVPFLLVAMLALNKNKSLKIISSEYISFYIFIFFYFISSIINYESLRVSSLVYSLLFLISFYLYYYLLKLHINIKVYKKWLEVIICVFFVGLLLQQIGVVFNVQDFFNKSSDIDYNISEDFIFSLNSLSTEPSYAVTTISICFFSLLKIKRKKRENKYSLKHLAEDKLIWFIYLYQIIFFRSVFGFLFLLIIIYYLLNLKSIKSFIFLVPFLILVLRSDLESSLIDRVTNIYENIDFNNLIDFWKVDHSASMRVLP